MRRRSFASVSFLQEWRESYLMEKLASLSGDCVRVRVHVHVCVWFASDKPTTVWAVWGGTTNKSLWTEGQDFGKQLRLKHTEEKHKRQKGKDAGSMTTSLSLWEINRVSCFGELGIFKYLWELSQATVKLLEFYIIHILQQMLFRCLNFMTHKMFSIWLIQGLGGEI